jgi:hypothetical protein
LFEPSTVRDALIGAFAGGVSGFVTTPLDVCKTYLQTQSKKGKFVGEMSVPYYTGFVSCFKGLYRRNGIKALFTGSTVRCSWTGFHSVIMFTTYEFMLKYV